MKEEIMENGNTIKESVRRHYGEIARRAGLPSAPSCCGAPELPTSVSESYEGIAGHAPDADLALGCGLPTAFADLRPGEVVLDLGSGAGNDVFVAARAVGESGRVIGVDMTPEMIEKAERNRQKLGLAGVEFRMGEIESLPVETGSVDAVISNCVLNLVPDKARAFSEIRRVLKPGGRFTVSDIVVEGELPEDVRKSAEMWAGCVSGAVGKEEYLSLARQAGFQVRVETERVIPVPVLGLEGARILSVTVRGDAL
jgi:SAM-dependent methyltransferase